MPNKECEVDPTYIIPFIKSAKNVFETMFQMPLNCGTPAIKTESGPTYDVSAIIGFAGEIEGAVVLSFPEAIARRIVTLFTGAEVTSKEDLSDAVGEIVNMVAGGAKAQFSGKKVSISCPSVVIGAGHVVHGKKDTIAVVIPASCDCGEFTIEIAMKNVGAGAAAQPASAGAAA